MGFVHLHVHSQYSFLDGASSLERLLERAKALDMPALALTDHNRLTGAVRFYEKAGALGIKPVIGAEISLEEGYHLTLLCKDTEGYSNLCRLLTEAHLSNRGRQPAATREMLAKFSNGLIALSGCSRGELPSIVERGNIGQARESAHFYNFLKSLLPIDYALLIQRDSKRKIKTRYHLSHFHVRIDLPIADAAEARIGSLVISLSTASSAGTSRSNRRFSRPSSRKSTAAASKPSSSVIAFRSRSSRIEMC